ncbi:MAG: transketolase, partial [Deltaproteobacteria bacterium]|nr:transketolase [Deltaproteobacteria bacterium]
MSKDVSNLDELSVNTLRMLAADGVEKANSGHPGMPMGDAAMAYVLWTKFLKHNPKNPLWAGRDRFVLSAGHGSMLLYSLLHLTGYNLSLDDLKNFRQWDSPTPGHPEADQSLGVETTTGPLGQGFANGVGIAMAERYLAERYNKPGFPLFDYNVYAIAGDGDMMEGISNEAASMAGHLKLGSIVYLYSDNHITIEGSTDISFTEDVQKRFEALEWHVIKLDDGNDLAAVEKAIEEGRGEKTRPTLIIVRTHIGFGSPNKADSSGVHGSPLGSDEIKKTKAALGWPEEPAFHIPDGVSDNFSAVEGGKESEAKWQSLFEDYEKEYPELAKEYKQMQSGDMAEGVFDLMPKYEPTDGAVATRSVSGKVLNAIAGASPFLIGGSADLAPSNNTYMNDMGEFSPTGAGQNIHYGVREHAMGAVMNGIAQSGGLVPFGGTFLVFSDYMRGAIRIAALSELQAIYVFTHDSIGLGEDGPTHQPIEHLASLRAMPNLTVLRPADAVETVEAWKVALLNKNGPSVLALTRQKLPVIDRAKYGASTANDVKRGGYILAGSPHKADDTPEIILIATGSEV